MKDYKKVAEDVFRRSGEVTEENKRRRRRLAEIGVSAACWAAVGAVGFGVWKTNFDEKNIKTVIPNSSTAQGTIVLPENSASISDDSNQTSDQKNDEPDNNNEFIDKDGIDIRCYPVIHLPMQEGYSAPKNGQMIITRALKEKLTLSSKIDMELFSVVIEYYKDGKRVDPTKEFLESERDRTGMIFLELEIDNIAGISFIYEEDASCKTFEVFTPREGYGCIAYLRSDFIRNINNSGEIKISGHISNIDADLENVEYSPENGTAVISESLKKAVEIYGKEDKNGEINYSVLVEYYKDGNHINPTMEIWGSEREKGLYLNFETYSSDWGNNSEQRIWKYMTVDELESFKPSGEYGYVLHLYNAYFGYEYKYDDNIINGLYNNGVYF